MKWEPTDRSFQTNKREQPGVVCIKYQMRFVCSFIHSLNIYFLLCACLLCVSYVTCSGLLLVELKQWYLGKHGTYFLNPPKYIWTRNNFRNNGEKNEDYIISYGLFRACFGDTSALSLLSPPQQQLSGFLVMEAHCSGNWWRRKNDRRKGEERTHHPLFW